MPVIPFQFDGFETARGLRRLHYRPLGQPAGCRITAVLDPVMLPAFGVTLQETPLLCAQALAGAQQDGTLPADCREFTITAAHLRQFTAARRAAAEAKLYRPRPRGKRPLLGSAAQSWVSGREVVRR